MINKVIHLFFSLLFLFSSWFSAYSVKYAVIENFNDVKYVSSSTSFYDVSPIICNEGDYRSFRVNKSPKLTSVFYLSLTNFNLYLFSFENIFVFHSLFFFVLLNKFLKNLILRQTVL